MSNWQAAEEGDLHEDLELEFELSNNTSEKECILFAVDCGPEMFKVNRHLDQMGTLTAFQAAMKCISSVMKNKIICAETDKIGVVCYNTGKSKNPAGFPHILQLLDIDVPDAPSILEIDRFARRPDAFKEAYGSSDQEFPFGNVFWTVANIFSDKKFVGCQKRVFLFTCEDHPNASSESLQKAARTRGKDLIDLGIELDLFAIPKDSQSAFNYTKFFSHILPELSAAINNPAADQEGEEHLSKLEELLTRVRRKESRKRALARTQLSFGPAMNVSVRIFSLFMETRKGQYVWMNERSGQVMTPKTEWICKETRQILEPSQFKFSFDYGGEKIVFSKDEKKKMYEFEEDTGLKILGFKPRSALKNSHNVTHSSFVYPDESIGGSVTAFSCLLKNCLELNKMVICRWTPWRGAPPRLVALLPQAEKLDEIGTQIKAPGFNMIILPFADDIRHLRFDEDAAAASDETAKIANHDQIDKAKALIGKLVIPGANVSFDNPVLQRHYANLQALALDQEVEGEVVDSTLPNYDRIKSKAEEEIIEFKNAIGLQNDQFSNSDLAVKETKKRSNDQDPITSIAAVLNDPAALSRFTVNDLKAYLESVGIKPKRLKASKTGEPLATASEMGEKLEDNFEEVKQIFTLFDRDGDGRVDSSDLGSILRASGRLPSEADIKEYRESESFLKGQTSFTFADLLSILAKTPVVDSSALRSALMDAFRVFDQSGSGEIGTQELRHIMTSLGEKLSEDEAAEMIKLADPSGTGIIKYENFVDKLVAK